MRPIITSPRPRPELATLPVHLVLRDYPETIVVFQRFDISLPEWGGEPVMAAGEGDAGTLLDELAEAIEWRCQ